MRNIIFGICLFTHTTLSSAFFPFATRYQGKSERLALEICGFRSFDAALRLLSSGFSAHLEVALPCRRVTLGGASCLLATY
jgi:hypothetical protein